MQASPANDLPHAVAASGIVTLLTDFGLREPFVGVMKGVILSRAPRAVLVDLSHQVPAHDVAFAAFWLANAAPWFPPGSVHLCVVDPGVGSERRALVAEQAGQWFVAPDNGVLSGALQKGAAVYHAPTPTEVSRTFHGRDVFAPLAADLASGKLRPPAVGPKVDDWVSLAIPAPVRAGRRVQGQVMAVDHFGNLLTNVRLGRDEAGRVKVAGVVLDIVESYQAAAAQAAALVNAWGLVEIAVFRGRACDVLGVAVGDSVEVEL